MEAQRDERHDEADDEEDKERDDFRVGRADSHRERLSSSSGIARLVFVWYL